MMLVAFDKDAARLLAPARRYTVRKAMSGCRRASAAGAEIHYRRQATIFIFLARWRLFLMTRGAEA